MRSQNMQWAMAIRWLVLVMMLANLLPAAGTPTVAAQDPEPVLHVVPAHPEVHGHEWDENALVTLIIEDGGGELYTDSKVAWVDAWCGTPCFDLQGVFDIQVGQTVTMGDGTITKTVTVTSLQVTEVDAVADTVSGTADAGTDVQVDIHDEGGGSRTVTADGSGDWVADFSIPGDEPHEQGVYDLGPGSHGRAIQFETEGTDDGTLAYWNVPNPHFAVRPEEDGVEGWEWLPSTPISLTINGTSYSTTSDEQGYFSLGGLDDIQSGDTVTVSDGVTLKDHTVTSLAVTGVDHEGDTVSGTAEADSQVWTWIHGEDGSEDVVTATMGVWTRYFSPWDLAPGTAGPAVQYDDDGDQTWIEWWVPNPRIEARPVEDAVAGWEWPEGPVALTIDDDDPNSGPLYSASENAYVPEWDPGTTYVRFDFQDTFDLQAGHTVTLSGGGFTKTHQVTALAVTGVDPANDTVFGTAAPDSQVWTWIHGEDGSEDVVTATMG
ncbi:MAG: hypothetical protein PVI59_17165, partial [Anaerolineae bacterium]